MARKKKKPNYNPERSMSELLRLLSEEYGTYDDRIEENHEMSLNTLARAFDLNVIKVRKLLITAGCYSTSLSRQVAKLKRDGKSVAEIVEETGLSRASVNSYLPYDGIAYKMPESSVDADRARVYRKRQVCLAQLQETLSVDTLWKAVVAFQNYLFHTASGLPFSYELKRGRDGGYNRELIVSRRKESKTLAWSSVVLAFHKALEMQEQVIDRPKALGDIRGISYIYPMLYRFGIIEVPEKIAERMQRKGGKAVCNT